MQAWTLAKTQFLGEVLIDRELMPQSQCELLEQLVDAHIAQHRTQRLLPTLPVQLDA